MRLPGAHVPAYVVSTTTGHKQQQHDPSAFSHRRNDTEISCDSQIALPIQEGEDVLIRRCDYHLNLIHPKDYSYFNTLSTKLGWSKIILILRQPLYCI